ncbi:RDD family protein [Streptacidiphilus monticola]
MTNPEPPSDPLAKHPQPPVDGGGLPYYTPPPEEPAPGPAGQMPPLGGLGRRLVARIIDGVLVAVVAVPLSLIATAAKRNDRQLYSLIIEIVVLLLYFLYEGLMLTHSHGQTVGKKVMRIRVANLADGTLRSAAPAGPGRPCGRCPASSAAAPGRWWTASGPPGTSPTRRRCTTRRHAPWWCGRTGDGTSAQWLTGSRAGAGRAAGAPRGDRCDCATTWLCGRRLGAVTASAAAMVPTMSPRITSRVTASMLSAPVAASRTTTAATTAKVP